MSSKPIKQEMKLSKGERIIPAKDIELVAGGLVRTWRHERARVAALSRDRGSGDPDLVEARKRLKSAREKEALDAHIAGVVAKAPELTPEQRDKLAIIFRPQPKPTKDEWDV